MTKLNSERIAQLNQSFDMLEEGLLGIIEGVAHEVLLERIRDLMLEDKIDAEELTNRTMQLITEKIRKKAQAPTLIENTNPDGCDDPDCPCAYLTGDKKPNIQDSETGKSVSSIVASLVQEGGNWHVMETDPGAFIILTDDPHVAKNIGKALQKLVAENDTGMMRVACVLTEPGQFDEALEDFTKNLEENQDWIAGEIKKAMTEKMFKVKTVA